MFRCGGQFLSQWQYKFVRYLEKQTLSSINHLYLVSLASSSMIFFRLLASKMWLTFVAPQWPVSLPTSHCIAADNRWCHRAIGSLRWRSSWSDRLQIKDAFAPSLLWHSRWMCTTSDAWRRKPPPRCRSWMTAVHATSRSHPRNYTPTAAASRWYHRFTHLKNVFTWTKHCCARVFSCMYYFSQKTRAFFSIVETLSGPVHMMGSDCRRAYKRILYTGRRCFSPLTKTRKMNNRQRKIHLHSHLYSTHCIHNADSRNHGLSLTI